MISDADAKDQRMVRNGKKFGQFWPGGKKKSREDACFLRERKKEYIDPRAY